ncbi:MAG: tetratricopeptide repeat protein [Treponema sp.]|jgi:tetratricopeptide (TPR) repeat protein|nr:tetratricopeptide repeat protein [Treponema sp.]
MAKKELPKVIIVFIILTAAIIGIYAAKKIINRNSLAAQIAALSPRGTPPQTIEDLRRAISLYEKKLEEHIKDTVKTGVYWKILGSRLMDGRQPQYGEALKALENAVRYYPDDESIHYLIGVSAGNLARSEYFSPREQEEHYRLAEAAYLRALDLYDRYAKALYGLGVLYIYALNRPEEAIPHMELYLDINTRDTDGMFVLAAARYMTEDFEGAVNIYDRIISLTKNKDVKMQAELNRQQVMDEWYR